MKRSQTHPNPWYHIGLHGGSNERTSGVYGAVRNGGSVHRAPGWTSVAGGYVCASCGGPEAWRLKERPRIYECRGCGHQESVTAGTIFHRTRTDLPKWFLAAYLIGKDKRGVSAKFLQRELGVAYQTAWTIAHKLRHGLREDPTWPIGGYPEAAETFTRAALAAANARGTVVGNLGSLAQGRRTRIQRAAKRAADLAPIIQAIEAEGITGVTGIAAALNARGVPAARGGQWRAIQVRRVLTRFSQI